jgi:ParB/RepB/Spo0J family partition protein
MQLEFHQLDRRWEHLRVRHPQQQRRLLASLVESGQQTPIVVVVSPDTPTRYLVIDGYKRVAALEQLGRDTVAATVWEMSAAEALLLSRSLHFSPPESALEQGWLLAEMEQQFSYPLAELARRFDRSVSWVTRRLGLVELLPEAIQLQVRCGQIAAQVAMKYLVPVARVDGEQCRQMAAAFVTHHCDARQARQLYTAWRQGSRTARERILAEPELFWKTQRQPPAATPASVEQLERDLEMALAILRRAGRRFPTALGEMNQTQQEQVQQRLESARRELDRMSERMEKAQENQHAEPGATNRDSGDERTGGEQTRDRARAADIPSERAQSGARQLDRCPADCAGGEGRALPPTDPGIAGPVQGESGASP